MFELALPWALFLLPVPLLIWFLIPRAPLYLPAALKVPFFSGLSSVIDSEQQNVSHNKKISLLMLIWCLLIIALSGPRWVGEPRPLTREGYNIMLALDLSGSMELNDMMLHGNPASRLDVVKQAAEQFVKQRTGDKIGLILFGSRAYLQTPLTYDHRNVLMRLDDASVGLAGKTTSIGDAIGLAVKRLESVPGKAKVIILLTDGANNSGVLSPIKAAELANTDHVKIYTIGLGSESDPRMLNRMFFNMNGTMDLDEGTLKEVARITGGKYFRATDLRSLQSIYETINKMEKVSQDQATIQPQHDYYAWPLAIGLLLFLIWLSNEAGLFCRFQIVSSQEVTRE